MTPVAVARAHLLEAEASIRKAKEALWQGDLPETADELDRLLRFSRTWTGPDGWLDAIEGSG